MSIENYTTQKFLIILSVVFILFANFAFWISGSLYDSEKFQSNVLESFKKPSVRDALASGIVDRLLEENPRLNQIANSPAKSAISGVLGSSYLEPVVLRLAGEFQHYLTTGQKEVSLDLTTASTLLTRIAGATGNTENDPQIKNTKITILPEEAFPKVNQFLKPITTLGPILGVLGLITLGYLIYRSKNRLLRTRKIGIYLSWATLINILMVPFAVSLIQQYAPTENAAVILAETFRVFAEDYLAQLLLILAISLILFSLNFFWRRYALSQATKPKQASK